MNDGSLRLIVRNTAVAAVYVGAASLCGVIDRLFGSESTFLWAPSGIALALMVAWGPSLLVGLWVGSLLANIASGYTGWQAAAMACGTTLAAVAGRRLLQRARFRASCEQVQDILQLLVWGAILASVISAGVATLVLSWRLPISLLGAAKAFGLIWLGDAMGVLLVTPILLTWRKFWRQEWRPLRLVEAVILLAILLASAKAIFSGWFPTQLPMAFVVFPLLVWAALRFGVCGASIAIWAVAIVAAQESYVSTAVFSAAAPHENLTWLHSFVMVAALTTQSLAAATMQRARVEEALQESQARLHAAFDNIPFDFWVMDPSGRYVMQNRTSAANWSNVVGKTAEEMGVAPEILQSWRETNARALSGEIVQGETEYKLQGELRSFYFVLAPVRDGDRVRGVLGVNIDITDRKRAEHALKESEELYRLLLENSSDWITRHSADGRYTWVSPVVRKVLGYEPEELLGRNPYEMFHPDDIARIRQIHDNVLARADTYAISYRLRRKDGSYVWLETRARALFDPAGKQAREIICSSSDISDRIRLEEELRQSQKLEAIGRLAGGVAHDFNNLLTIINGYSDLLLTSLDDRDPSRALVEEVRRAGERAAGLTRQLLAFSRKQVLRPVVIDINALVRDMERMLRRVIREDVELVTRLERGLFPVRADRGQVEQVILNLTVNARDAMPSGGRLSIETRNVRRAGAGDGDGRGAGRNQVEVRVGDTGSGMDETTRARAFEPFFTTKERGKGTGLGLAMVYGIVKQSGGDIEIQSSEGQGTTFVITLPAEEGELAAIDPELAAAPVPGGSERILLVEDEESVRSLASRILKRHGYQVVEARRGADALALCEQGEHPIDLLVTDVIMPGMSGPELVDRLSRTRPDLRVLYISGYADVSLPELRAGGTQRLWLQKPFTAGDLASSVRRLLDG